ncbi:MAG TPA: head maturation protease, ClpP-related [Verrucomicrobiae bacterium]|nr:head maturation protease, ClpP-related [Verrucomicrobiae bacterium]
MKTNFPIFADAAGVKSSAGKYSVVFNAATDDKDAEILIHGPIGRSFWSDDGITGKDFTDALNKVPVGTRVNVGINSQGGSVNEGLAIFNAISRRKGDVTCRIDGYALSIASYFPLAAAKVISPKSALWMIHNPWSWVEGCSGDADDMRKYAELINKSADMLEKHGDVLVAAYTERTKRTDKQIRSAMKEETWLTGEEAVEWGLADEVNDESAALDALDFSGMEAKAFKRIPLACRSLILAAAGQTKHLPAAAADPNSAPKGGANKKTDIVMNRNQMLALLKSWGVETNDSLTDEQLVTMIGKGKPQASAPAAPAAAAPATTIDITAEIQKGINAEMAKVNKRAEADKQLAALVAANKITQAQAEKALPAILSESGEVKDSAVLAALGQNPVRPEPAEPVAIEISEESASVKDIEAGLAQMRKPILSLLAGNDPDVKAMQKNAVAINAMITKNRNKIREALAANTISSDLQRNVILSDGMRAFKRRILPLSIFSTRFNNVPLEGTNKIAVPYYPLFTTTSKDFSDGTGYQFDTSTSTLDKDVTINKRKYQPFNFYSHLLSRQPYFNTMRLMELKAEQLALDVWLDVLGVFTLATYGATVKLEQADAFDSDDVIDIGGSCDDSDWPDTSRSLVLLTSYHTNLKKDPSLKNADKSGSESTLREGSTGRVDRFDIYHSPRFPNNSENLVGLAVLPSAALVATSPIAPGPGVRRQLVSYDVVVDPTTGVAFEYRYWGDADQDEEREIVEVNYGFNAGEAAAAKRITNG